MKIINIRFVVMLATLFPLESLAEPDIAYQYSPSPTLNIVGVNAIVNLEEAYKDCDQRIADLVIDEVVYEGASDTVIGFRAQKPGKKTDTWYGLFTMSTESLYGKLSNAERRNVLLLVKKGAKVIVAYQVCGSGSFSSVRDIYAKSAINNP